jgi:hypothetical protein
MAGKKTLRLPFLRMKPAAMQPSSGGTIVADTDLYGKPTTVVEQEALRAYQALKMLAARDDLPPCAARNVRKALACLWQVTNDLDLQFEQLYDLGV